MSYRSIENINYVNKSERRRFEIPLQRQNDSICAGFNSQDCLVDTICLIFLTKSHYLVIVKQVDTYLLNGYLYLLYETPSIITPLPTCFMCKSILTTRWVNNPVVCA